MGPVRFSVHALERLKERSKLSSGEMADMFECGACSLLRQKNSRRYFVIWDNRLAKPLLVIVSERNRDSLPTVITLFDTWERDNVRGVKVKTGHVEEAYRLRRRYLTDKITRIDQIAKTLIRVDLIVGHQEDGFLTRHSRRSDIFRILPEDYASQFGSDWRRLLQSCLADKSLLEQITVRKGDRIYIELWQKEKGGKRKILLKEEVR